ncbi:hypothetical protein FQN57_004569 [Myotisia sp. PD_48]|nr:hypothetical protein FQN57_004569 [Myotisia sp. PD_48]
MSISERSSIAAKFNNPKSTPQSTIQYSNQSPIQKKIKQKLGLSEEAPVPKKLHFDPSSHKEETIQDYKKRIVESLKADRRKFHLVAPMPAVTTSLQQIIVQLQSEIAVLKEDRSADRSQIADLKYNVRINRCHRLDLCIRNLVIDLAKQASPDEKKQMSTMRLQQLCSSISLKQLELYLS